MCVQAPMDPGPRARGVLGQGLRRMPRPSRCGIVGSHPSPLVRGTGSDPTPRGGPMQPSRHLDHPRSGNSILGSLSSCASCCRHARRARHWGHREVSFWALIVPVHVERHIHPVVRGSARSFTVGSSVAVSNCLPNTVRLGKAKLYFWDRLRSSSNFVSLKVCAL